MSVLPEQIIATTPCCVRLVHFDRMEHATLVTQRTCRKCRKLWHVKVTPLVTAEGMNVHEVVWTPK